ncbi:MAG: hypothetical protein ABI969_04430 [bacterium]
MAASNPPQALREAFRRHERRLAALWLGATVLLVLIVLVKPVRMRALARVQVAVDWWDHRWERRLAEGQKLVEAKRFAEAAPFLLRLDREFPARHTRYGRDKEREVLLELLARTYEELGHKNLAMQTWTRLTKFDSLNYRNHVAYAHAAERLLGGWAEAPETRDGYAHALRLLPSHLPSERGYLKFYLDRGEFITVRDSYKAYLDAFLVERFTITAGDTMVSVPVSVDGNAHTVEFALARPAGWHGEFVIASPTYPLSVEGVSVTPAQVVGAPAAQAARSTDLAGLRADRMTKSGDGWVPADSSATIHIPVQADAQGIARVQLRLRAFKLMDKKLWDAVNQSYRNLLDEPGLADATARTAPYASAERADRAFDLIGWSQGGKYNPREP